MEEAQAKTDEQIVESLLSPAPDENQTGEVTENEAEEEADNSEEVDEAEAEESADADDDTDEEETDELEEEDSDESEDEDAEDADDDEEPDYYTVKVNGKEEQVTLEELKRGYSGQTHIQREMQKVADERKSLEETQAQTQQFAQALQQERERLLQSAQMAQQGGFMAPPQEPDPQMLKDDPIGFMEAEADYKQKLKQYQEQQQQFAYQQQQAQQYYQQQHQQVLEENKRKLIEAIPELGDAKEAPKKRDALVEHAVKNLGWTEDEVKAATDWRIIKAVNDSLELQRLKEGREQAKQPKRKPKPIRKGTGSQKTGKAMQRKKQLEKARKTQSDADWANLLLE